MARKKKNEPHVDNIPQSEVSKHDEVRKRVRKHISDKNSRISEADIRNVKVDTLPPSEIDKSKGEIIPHPERETDEKLPGKTSDGHNKHVTPWDVVSE